MSAMVAQIRGEWRKVRTLRSTWAIAGLGLVAELVLRTVSVVILPRGAGPGETAFALRPSILFAVLVALLPTLAAAAEWRWKTSISTYAVQPRRSVVLLGKAVVGTGIGAAVAALLTVSSLAVSLSVLQVRDLDTPDASTLSSLTVGPIVSGAVLGCAAVALGTAVREQVVALTVAVLLFFVAPLPLILIGPQWYAWSPAAWLDAVSGLEVANPELPPIAAAALLWLAMAVGGLTAASWRLHRMDVA